MSYENMILEIAKKNNGIVTSYEITNKGISREYLRILSKKGLLERSARGIYNLPSVFSDEMFSLQIRYKKGIFSHETALFLLDLSDRNPLSYNMTFPLSYNTSKIDSDIIKYYRVKKSYYSLGIISKKTPGGNKVRLYNAERTLCDILKKRSETEIQIVTDAFKRYVKLDKKNIPLLSDYAKLFRVEKKLRDYLEVLL